MWNRATDLMIKGRSAEQRANDALYQYRGRQTAVRTHIPPISAPVPRLHGDTPTAKSAPAKPYEYTALDDAGGFIRILALTAGSPGQPLSGEIFSCPISKVVHYEALSYRWGKESSETDLRQAPHIRFGDQYLKITPSLHEALCVLRYSNEPRRLWVDQVCIDQANGKEKEKQLSLMGMVYRHAQRAVIWLGMPTEDDEAVLSLIEAYKPLWQQLEARVGQELRATGTEHNESARAAIVYSRSMEPPEEQLRKSITSVSTLPQISASQVPKILGFFNKPWFTRTWPVQEVVLSRIKIVRCGSVEIEWAYVGYFASMFMHKFPDVEIEAERLRGVHAANHIHWWSKTYEGGFSLLALLRTIRNHEAFEDKDKIYGILNMVDFNLSSSGKAFSSRSGKAIPALLKPDCSKGKTAVDVYHDVACYLINRDKTLHVLTFACEESKPTWVP